jgi:hypothetical protein
VNRSRRLAAKLPRDLDPGIAVAVRRLNECGVETFESCQGGEGHAYSEPTVRFFGERSEGFRAFAVAVQWGLRVSEVRRVWPINDGEPTGPWWELTFVPIQEE